MDILSAGWHKWKTRQMQRFLRGSQNKEGVGCMMTRYEEEMLMERLRMARELFELGYDVDRIARCVDEPAEAIRAYFMDIGKLSGDPVRKYNLVPTDQTYSYHGKEIHLYRIWAMRNIYDEDGVVLIEKGDRGGFVDSEQVLSHAGTCWIGGNAIVIESTVTDYVSVAGSAVIVDSRLSGFANIQGQCYLEDVILKGDGALICGSSKIQHCTLEQDISIGNHVEITGVTMSGQLVLHGDTIIEARKE